MHTAPKLLNVVAFSVGLAGAAGLLALRPEKAVLRSRTQPALETPSESQAPANAGVRITSENHSLPQFQSVWANAADRRSPKSSPRAASASYGSHADDEAEARMPDAPDNEYASVAAAEDKDQLLRKLREWASQDAEGALASVLKLPAGEERSEALEAVCFGLAELDPATAVEMAITFNLDDRSATIENLAQRWAAADLRSAVAWANNQPAGEPRDRVLARIAFVQAQTAPAEAARLVVDQIAAGPAQTEAVMMVLHQWGNRDLLGAASWAEHFPEGSLRERAIRELESMARFQGELTAQ